MPETPENDRPESKPHVEDSHIELVADEDWKERVKAEDAKLDADRTAHQQPAGRTESKTQVDPASMPTPGLDSIIQLFMTQAMVALGLVPDPTGKTETALPLARYFIDILAVLEEKTKGNLSPAEERLLEGALHQLRMTYIEVSRKQ